MKYRSVGVTGTRNGMTEEQQKWVREFLYSNSVKVLHHGDCIGADDEAAIMFRNIANSYIIAHPGHIHTLRARSVANDLTLPWSNTLIRNRMIVNHSDFILAFPATKENKIGSGTWHTIMYARNEEKPIVVVGPDGVEIH